MVGLQSLGVCRWLPDDDDMHAAFFPWLASPDAAAIAGMPAPAQYAGRQAGERKWLGGVAAMPP